MTTMTTNMMTMTTMILIMMQMRMKTIRKMTMITKATMMDLRRGCDVDNDDGSGGDT